jgi:hypothetical protein
VTVPDNAVIEAPPHARLRISRDRVRDTSVHTNPAHSRKGRSSARAA